MVWSKSLCQRHPLPFFLLFYPIYTLTNYFASINSTKKTNSELNSIKLNIDINLGEKAKIKEIIFLGDKKIKDKRLLEVIASEEHKFWKFITSKVYLNKSLIDLDKRLLENYYKNNGFYKVEILNSFAELDIE